LRDLHCSKSSIFIIFNIFAYFFKFWQDLSKSKLFIVKVTWPRSRSRDQGRGHVIKVKVTWPGSCDNHYFSHVQPIKRWNMRFKSPISRLLSQSQGHVTFSMVTWPYLISRSRDLDLSQVIWRGLKTFTDLSYTWLSWNNKKKNKKKNRKKLFARINNLDLILTQIFVAETSFEHNLKVSCPKTTKKMPKLVCKTEKGNLCS